MSITDAKLRRIFTSAPFLNPYSDDSDPKLWPEEVVIVRRIIAGEKLASRRVYVTEQDCHAVIWYWEMYPDYPAVKGEYDCPVMRLMSRGVVRRVQCYGGADEMILTPAAEEAIGRISVA